MRDLKEAARAEKEPPDLRLVSSKKPVQGPSVPLPHEFIDFWFVQGIASTLSRNTPHTYTYTMADDTTRQTATPEKAFTSDQWSDAEATHAKKPENANVYAAAASQHTAGGSAEDVTLVDAAKTIKIDDFASLPKKPCVRDSLLTGMTAGFVVGSSRAIWRAPIQSATNWAVGTFVIGSAGMYQYCQYKRLAEKEGMTRAMEIIDRKQIERKQKEARMERARELRRQKKEEDDSKKFAELNPGNTTPGDTKPSSSWKLW
ncbi:hypothetical protein D6C86_08329 [Aureobasidium pullulans]|nr:hypothetical protein D6C86_08329 [Aureobasidium pullulans]